MSGCSKRDMSGVWKLTWFSDVVEKEVFWRQEVIKEAQV